MSSSSPLGLFGTKKARLIPHAHAYGECGPAHQKRHSRTWTNLPSRRFPDNSSFGFCSVIPNRAPGSCKGQDVIGVGSCFRKFVFKMLTHSHSGVIPWVIHPHWAKYGTSGQISVLRQSGDPLALRWHLFARCLPVGCTTWDSEFKKRLMHFLTPTVRTCDSRSFGRIFCACLKSSGLSGLVAA